MNDILDDNLSEDDFKKKEPIEKFEASEDGESEFLPHIQIESRDIEAVLLLLEQYGVPYQVVQGSNFDSTGIVPLTGNQLDSIKMTVYIPKKSIETADQIMADYRARKEAELPKADVEYQAKNIAFIVSCLLFVAYVLWKEYRKIM